MSVSKIITATLGAALLATGMAGTAGAQDWGGRWNGGYEQRDHDRDGRWGHGFGNGGGPRFAVEQCRRAATDAAMRGASNARVTDIGLVRPTGDGFRVSGEIAIYRRGWNGGASYDRTGFTCRTDRGQVADVRIGGRRW